MLLNVNQAATHLQLSSDVIYELVEQRKIRHLRVGPGERTIRFRLVDLEDYAESCIVEPRSSQIHQQSSRQMGDRIDLKAVINQVKRLTT